ncbi:MAG: VlmB-like protein [Pyrinomonadaceae bacterium]
MNAPVPTETDPAAAPRLLDGAANLTLTPEHCNAEYWLNAVAHGTWLGLKNGHAPDLTAPPHMLAEGPLRTAVIDEFALSFLGEVMAARAISYLVASAPALPLMEFYATQLIDEVRHALTFRTHLVELGVAPAELLDTVERRVGRKRDAILKPLEQFGLKVLRDEGDFIGGVIVLTVLVEGVMASSEELNEREWRRLDPAAAGILRVNSIDEIRHLTVGCSIVRQHLVEHPEDKARILSLIGRGWQLWQTLPVQELAYERETLIQQGIETHRDLLGDYELTEGRPMADTTAEERLMLAAEWSGQLQRRRLTQMGLEEALP